MTLFCKKNDQLSTKMCAQLQQHPLVPTYFPESERNYMKKKNISVGPLLICAQR